jgi:hypothetical protein
MAQKKSMLALKTEISQCMHAAGMCLDQPQILRLLRDAPDSTAQPAAASPSCVAPRRSRRLRGRGGKQKGSAAKDMDAPTGRAASAEALAREFADTVPQEYELHPCVAQVTAGACLDELLNTISSQGHLLRRRGKFYSCQNCGLRRSAKKLSQLARLPCCYCNSAGDAGLPEGEPARLEVPASAAKDMDAPREMEVQDILPCTDATDPDAVVAALQSARAKKRRRMQETVPGRAATSSAEGGFVAVKDKMHVAKALWRSRARRWLCGGSPALDAAKAADRGDSLRSVTGPPYTGTEIFEQLVVMAATSPEPEKKVAVRAYLNGKVHLGFSRDDALQLLFQDVRRFHEAVAAAAFQDFRQWQWQWQWCAVPRFAW